ISQEPPKRGFPAFYLTTAVSVLAGSDNVMIASFKLSIAFKYRKSSLNQSFSTCRNIQPEQQASMLVF
ncbi:hypothetical protein ACR91F_26865, partial [Klebsiella pneumoniae]